MRKRILSLAMAIAMLLTAIPFSTLNALASYSGVLQFDSAGKFTVMQLADIQDYNNVNSRVISLITKAIARYSPDLVVFTGDNISGTVSTSMFQTAVNGFLAPLLNTNTKFAVTFGNHDDEKIALIADPGSKTEQYNYYMSKGGSNFINHDVVALDGVGSGSIPIYAAGQTGGTPKFQVFLMDSGTYMSDGSYNNPTTNQVDYYLTTNPTVPSLWFQHIPVPQIYNLLTQVPSGTANSFTGSTSPYNSSAWALNSSLMNWNACGGTTAADTYKEAPCPCKLTTSQDTAHRSSASYGSKTLYEAWLSTGNLKGAFFGHDHKNSFVGTTTDGITLGYDKSAGLNSYNDGNPGVRIFEIDQNGTYTTKSVTESDLAIPAPDMTTPTGTLQVIIKTRNSGFLTAYGTDDNAYVDIYYADGTTYKNGYLDDTVDGNDFEQGDLNTCYLYNVPIKPVTTMRFRDKEGADDWTVEYVYVNYKVNGAYTRVAEITARHKYTNANETVICSPNPTTWFTTNNRTLTFNANGGTGGKTIQIVYGATLPPSYVPTVTKAGYTFSGWSPAVPEYGPGANTTYTAQWTAN